jgi:hypothetical protein
METLPDEIRVLNIWGAEYYIPWEGMRVGASFFVPTTALVSQVRPQLRKIAAHFDWGLEARQRCEFGRYGIRVWRVY